MTDSTSYWQANNPVVLPTAALPALVDLVVIGGGWLGTCTAYYAARRGARVALLERSQIAAGASGRNGGFMVAGTAEEYPAAIARVGHANARAVHELTRTNRQLLRAMLDEEGFDCDYREPGNLRLAINEAQLTELRAEVAALNADGYQAEIVDAQTAAELAGLPFANDMCGARYVPDNGLLHSTKLVAGVAQAAARHGAQIRTGVRVQGLNHHTHSVQVMTDQGVIAAAAVVVCVNGWSSELVSAVDGLVMPVRGQALAYAPIAPTLRIGLGSALSATGEYWQQTLDGTIVIGGGRTVAPGWDVGVRETTPTAHVQAAIETVLPRLFPTLEPLTVAQRWAGTMAFTSDYLPVADRVPDQPNVWLTGGFCGHGMPFGAVLGHLLSQAALSGQRPTELAPLALDRPTLKPYQR